METNGINYTRHIYNLVPGTEKPTEYHLIKNSLQRALLPEEIRIEPGNPENIRNRRETLCVNNCRSWEYGARVTDLLPTSLKNVFEGNLKNAAVEKSAPESLIFFEFSKNRELLVIDLFKGFYTDNPFAFSLILESHQFLLHKKGSR